MEKYPKDLGNRILERRLELGLSRKVVGDAIGLTEGGLADIENGRVKKFNQPTIESISRTLRSSFGLEWLNQVEAVRFDLDLIIRNLIKDEVQKTFDNFIENKFESMLRNIVRQEIEAKGKTKTVELPLSDENDFFEKLNQDTPLPAHEKCESKKS